jgi:hypothetical protein
VPPNLQQLVRLGQEHCRTPCRLTNNAGVKVAGVCGQKVKDCKQHASKRLGTGNYQYVIGSYPPVLVSRGFTGHGLASGPCYTDSQVLAFQAGAAKEMALLVGTMNEDGSDEGEMEDLARDVRIRFTSPTPAPGKNKPSVASETYDLRKALAASSGGPSKKKKSPPAPVLWFGMVSKQGMRWVTANSTEAHSTVSKKHCRIEKVFQTQAESEAWLDEAWLEKEEPTGPNLIPSDLARDDSDSDEDDSSVSEVDKASAKANRLKKKKQNRKARRKKEKKESEAKAKKKPHKPEPRRPSNKGRHKSDNESDPSEFSEDSDSSSSGSDSSSSTSSNDDSSADSDRSSPSDSSAKRSSRRQIKKKKYNQKSSKKPRKDKSGKKGKKSATNYHK